MRDKILEKLKCLRIYYQYLNCYVSYFSKRDAKSMLRHNTFTLRSDMKKY